MSLPENSIDLSPEHKRQVLDLLAQHLPDTEVWAYGSRVKWTAKPASDLDLVAFTRPEQKAAVSELCEAFEESTLPFRVDFFEWDDVPESFRKGIQEKRVVLQNISSEIQEFELAKKLNDVAKIEMGQSPPGNSCNSIKEGVPLLNGPTEFGPEHPSPVQWTTDPKRTAQPGDLLFCVRGSTTGRMNWADQEYAIGRGIAAIRPRRKKIHRLLRAAIENQIPELLTAATGSTFPNVSRKQLEYLKWVNLEEDYWEPTSNFLKTLDDKIAVNRKLNETLEKMAQALYQSWFVDFDPVKAKLAALRNGQDPEKACMAAISGKLRIPPGKPTPDRLDDQLPSAEDLDQAIAAIDTLSPEQLEHLSQTAALFPSEFQESELGLIPEGWEIGVLSDVIELIGGGTPKRTNKEYWDGDVPWFSVKDAPSNSDIYVLVTSEKITSKGLNESSTKLLRKGTTIITARGTVGRLAMVGVPMAMNQSCYGVVGKTGFLDAFIYMNLRFAVEDLKQRTHGAVFDTITQNTFKDVEQVIPRVPVVQEFEKSVNNIFDMVRNNGFETLLLANLRDTLLPKLLSGELSVGEAEQAAENAETRRK